MFHGNAIDRFLARLTLDEQISFMRTSDMTDEREVYRGVDTRHCGMSNEELASFPIQAIISPLFALGSWVLIGDNIPATVRQIIISEGGHVEYQVVWWDEREREEVWLSAYEVKPHPDSKQMEVGFHSIQKEDGNG